MNKRIALKFVVLTIAGLAGAVSAMAQTTGLQFFALAPCRVADTRGGPSLRPGATRDFAIRANCGVPSTAKVVSLNVTITGATTASFLTLWPSAIPRPNVSTINFSQDDPSLANGAIVSLSTAASDLSVFNSGGNVDVILDVTGYFQ